MRRRRVKITGIGPVTPAGIGREAFWEGILEPVSRISRLKRISEEAGVFIGAEVKDFRFEQYAPEVSSKRVPRHTQLAVAASVLALRDAGLSIEDLRGRSPLVIVGASLMDFGAINKLVENAVRKGLLAPASPATVFNTSVSSISGFIGELIGGTTRTLALQSACCAGLDAIGHAAEMIATGEADIALCGGTESPLYFHPMQELKLAGLAPGNPEHPERQCRPFDLWRTTGVIGEGACILLLEPEESPRPGYAFVAGYAFGSDSLDVPGSGLVDAVRVALANANIAVHEVESINAWGPGHRIIDAAEARALRNHLGHKLALIPAASLKGAIGNPLGAAGAIQAGCAALGLKHSIIPPTVNWEFPDPACPLNLSGRVRFVSHNNTIINAHGLSGTNACVVLKL